MTDTQVSIQILNPFTDVVPPVYNSNQASTDFDKFSMGGGGENGLKADEQGMWFGAKTFAAAPFKVDMSGNVTINSLVITGGTMKSGKTAFSDATHAGYYIGNEGVYFGTASDAKAIKFDISAGTFLFTGIALSWADVSGAGKPANNATVGATWNSNISGQPTDASITNPSYITSTKITSTTIESPTITAGTITGATIQTNAVTYPYVKINSSGVTVSGTSTLNFITSSGTTCGWIGGDIINGDPSIDINNTSGAISIYGRYGVYIDASASDTISISGMSIDLSAANGGAVRVSGGDFIPYYNASYNCGDSSHLWANVHTLNLSLAGGNYINYTGGFIQSNSQFRVVGSINLTGNITMENYASITAKDSGGTNRTLTCQYNSTLGRYILST